MSEPYRWARASAPDGADILELAASGEPGTLLDLVRAHDRGARAAGIRASVLAAGFDPARDRCALAAMGDARAYLFRPGPARRELPVPLAPRYCPEVITGDGGGLVCLTWDHSTACDLVELDLIDRGEGRRRARRRVLTRSLGARPPTEPDLVFVALAPGDRLLLCNAGLWLAVDDPRIAALAAAGDIDAVAHALVDEAVAAGGRAPAALAIEWRRPQPQPRADSAPAAEVPAALRRFGRDLTALARGTPPPILGRKNELRALLRTLVRMQKPNALLVGEPGVGKTWLVEALAHTLASPACPPPLHGARVFELSLSALLAGTRFRGDFEERLEAVIAAAEAEPRLVLFIDELHLITGAGAGADGGMGAADILKPALARGRLRVIGATTPRELDRHLAGDAALMRRLELIRVDEPGRVDALAIVDGAAPALEQHHGARITASAREAAVDLSIRYLPDRRLPDKALDLLDQACARAITRALSLSLSATPLSGDGHEVGAGDVAAVIAERCGLPLELVSLTDSERLSRLPGLLAERVIGQPDATDAAARALQRGYRGLGEPGRPIASMLFAGPTGVGKTSLARAVAELLFDSDEALLRLDMTEYSEGHAVARLLGAAPGYVGHSEEGQLVAALRARPARVVLFDEIDKAHPDVLQLLLQILDAGWVRGARGHAVSFRDAVVILTSNLLADEPAPARGIGFGARAAGPDAGDDEALRRRLEGALAPELVGRLGAVIRFRRLGPQALAAIADRHLARVLERVLASGASSSVPPRALRDRVVAAIAAARYGARDVERAVEREVEAWLERAASSRAPRTGEVLVDRMTARPRTSAAVLIAADADVPRVLAQLQAGPAAGDLLYLRHGGAVAVALFGSARAATAAGRASGARCVVDWGKVERLGPDARGAPIDRALAATRAIGSGVAIAVTGDARDHLPDELAAALEQSFEVTLPAGPLTLWR